MELGNLVAVCGGLGHNPSNQGQEITFISPSIEAETYKCFKAIDHGDEATRRPFMVGTSIVKMGHDELFVVGGGATCFSMGTFWQTGIFRIVIPKLPNLVSHSMQKDAPANAITCSGPHRVVRTDRLDAELSLTSAGPSITAVPRIKLNSEDDFLEVLRERRPVVIEGLNLGDCLQKWNPDHLTERVGSERKVSDTEACGNLAADCYRWSFTNASRTRQRWTSTPRISVTQPRLLVSSWIACARERDSIYVHFHKHSHRSSRPVLRAIFRPWLTNLACHGK